MEFTEGLAEADTGGPTSVEFADGEITPEASVEKMVTVLPDVEATPVPSAEVTFELGVGVELTNEVALDDAGGITPLEAVDLKVAVLSRTVNPPGRDVAEVLPDPSVIVVALALGLGDSLASTALLSTEILGVTTPKALEIKVTAVPPESVKFPLPPVEKGAADVSFVGVGELVFAGGIMPEAAVEISSIVPLDVEKLPPPEVTTIDSFDDCTGVVAFTKMDMLVVRISVVVVVVVLFSAGVAAGLADVTFSVDDRLKLPILGPSVLEKVLVVVAFASGVGAMTPPEPVELKAKVEPDVESSAPPVDMIVAFSAGTSLLAEGTGEEDGGIMPADPVEKNVAVPPETLALPAPPVLNTSTVPLVGDGVGGAIPLPPVLVWLDSVKKVVTPPLPSVVEAGTAVGGAKPPPSV